MRARRRLLTVLAGVAILSTLAIAAVWYFLPKQTSDLATLPILASSSRLVGTTLQIDLGKVWFASVSIAGNAQQRGKTLAVRMGERLGPDHLLDPTPYGSVRFFNTQVTLAASKTLIQLPEADQRGMPAGVAVMPFRYIEIADWPNELSPTDVEVTAYLSRYFTPAGSIRFEGNDDRSEQLNRLMDLGAHTMAATSFMGVFVDGDRERLPYQADAYINQLGWYAVTGDTHVARRTLAELFREPTWPSEWMSQTILLAWEIYNATGDQEFLRQVYDRLAVFTLGEFVDDTGLVSTTDSQKAQRFVDLTGADYLEDIVDWPKGERDGYDMVAHNTVVNAFVFEALSKMEAMADALGKGDDADSFGKRATALKTAMQTQLIDPQSGLFRDGKESQHISAHALFVPLAFGLVPKDNVGGTVAAIQARVNSFGGGFPSSVYGAQFLLDGLFDHGGTQLAMDLMLNRTDRGWLHMMDAYDATVTHEAWDIAYKDNLDWNHAWGSAFLNVMFRKIVGVTILEPGWRRWSLAPAPGIDIPMSAILATPWGQVEVDIQPKIRTITLAGGEVLAMFVIPSDSGWRYKLLTAP